MQSFPLTFGDKVQWLTLSKQGVFNTRPSLPLNILIRKNDVIVFSSYHQLAFLVNLAIANRWKKLGKRIYKNYSRHISPDIWISPRQKEHS